MTILNHRLSDWIAAGLAFGAGLLLTGCASTSTHCETAEEWPAARTQPVAQVPVAHKAAAAPLPDPAAVATGAPVAAEAWPEVNPARSDRSAVINVFGEIGSLTPRRPTGSTDSSFQQHTNSDEGFDADVVTDPSGKWLAFSSTRHSERRDIYLQRVDGTSVVQLTTDPADDAQPSFSPDGKHVAFCSTRSGNWDLFLMDIDGKSVQQITNTPGHEMHPSFSPDGSRLVYCALSPRSDQWEIWTIDLSTQSRRMIGQGLFPTWSPRTDKDQIAFQRARQRGSRWFSLWTVDLVEGEPRKLTEVTVSSQFAVLTPSWSPDGTRLAFAGIADPEKHGAAGEQSAKVRQDIWVVSADGSARQKLTDGNGTNLSPFWSSDNRVYFVSDRSGHENVWSVRIDPAPTFTANRAQPQNNHAAGNTHGTNPSASGASEQQEIHK